MLSFPLRVKWVESDGKSVECEAQTVSVNRHGARIRVGRPLPAGQVVQVLNRVSRHEASFRVAGLVSPLTSEGGMYGVLGPVSGDTPLGNEFGVECLDGKENFWGIYFPPLNSEDRSDAKALLDCRRCHTVALLRLSLVEVDVLETAGTLSWPCQSCGQVTSWGYAEKERKIPVDDKGKLQVMAKGFYWREHRRVALQLPVLIRRYSGGVEIAQTEDVSKGGLSFISEVNYEVGEGLLVACPYSSSGPNIEVQAQLARRQEIKGTKRCLFGVRYSTPPG